ncbi:MAG: NfeD family protein, partial [Acidobacteriota bacterium]|nr:NfeD family protein [Acidobacteriota bacterium]
ALLFAVGLALVLTRHRGKGRAAAAAVARRKVDPLVGSEGVTLEALAPGRLGRVELAGESWNARLTTSRPLPAGARVRVERVEGLTVFVSPLR